MTLCKSVVRVCTAALVLTQALLAQSPGAGNAALRGINGVYVEFVSKGANISNVQMLDALSSFAMQLGDGGLSVLTTDNNSDRTDDATVSASLLQTSSSSSVLKIEVTRETGPGLPPMIWTFTVERNAQSSGKDVNTMIHEAVEMLLAAWRSANIQKY